MAQAKDGDDLDGHVDEIDGEELAAMAVAAYEQADMGEAQAIADQAVSLGIADVLIELAEAAESVGDATSAIRWFGAAVGIGEVEAVENLVELLVETGGWDAVLSFAEEQGDSIGGPLLTALAQEAHTSGESEAARQLLQPAAGRGDVDAIFSLVTMLSESGDRESAKSLLMSASQSDWASDFFRLDGIDDLLAGVLAQPSESCPSTIELLESIAAHIDEGSFDVFVELAIATDDHELAIAAARVATKVGFDPEGLEQHTFSALDDQVKGWCLLWRFVGSQRDASPEALKATAAVFAWLASDASREARQRGISGTIYADNGKPVSWAAFVSRVHDPEFRVSGDISLSDSRLLTSVLDEWTFETEMEFDPE
jgi:hypothetical protein